MACSVGPSLVLDMDGATIADASSTRGAMIMHVPASMRRKCCASESVVMSTLSDAQHFRRMLAGTCMIMAPLVLLASAIVAPSMSSTKEGPTLQAIADHQGRFYLSTALLIVGLVLLV